MNEMAQFMLQNTLIFILLLLWSVVWKGLALWHSARNSQTVWFVVLLVVNTLGILEILYIAFFRRKRGGNVG